MTTSLVPVKVVIAGGFGVGKTTFVGAISDIVPLTTEAALTTVSEPTDHTPEGATKTTTTVALDFGRIALGDDLVLYVFGVPGQQRFHFLWPDLSRGAIGAVVLVDTRRIEDSFASVDWFERMGLPFVVGVNCFTDAPRYTVADVREALAVRPEVPVLLCDARDRESTKQALIALVEHALAAASATTSVSVGRA